MGSLHPVECSLLSASMLSAFLRFCLFPAIIESESVKEDHLGFGCKMATIASSCLLLLVSFIFEKIFYLFCLFFSNYLCFFKLFFLIALTICLYDNKIIN